jgi:hypothetical protein
MRVVDLIATKQILYLDYHPDSHDETHWRNNSFPSSGRVQERAEYPPTAPRIIIASTESQELSYQAFDAPLFRR